MTKCLWQYSAKWKSTSAGSSLGIEITSLHQQVLEITMASFKIQVGGALNFRSYYGYNSNKIAPFIIQDENATQIHLPNDDYLAGHKNLHLPITVFNDDYLTFYFLLAPLNETLLIEIRGKTNTYALPKIEGIVATSTLDDEYLNRIVAVEDN